MYIGKYLREGRPVDVNANGPAMHTPPLREGR